MNTITDKRIGDFVQAAGDDWDEHFDRGICPDCHAFGPIVIRQKGEWAVVCVNKSTNCGPIKWNSGMPPQDPRPRSWENPKALY